MATKTQPARRKTYRVQPISPQFPEVPDPAVTCCHCGASFRTSMIEGDYLERRCPACGEPLSAATYDRCHAELTRQLEALAPLEAQAQEERAKWERISSRIDRLPRIVRWVLGKPLSKHLEQTQHHLDELRMEQGAIRTRRDKLAFSRYHVSEWFLCSHTPLKQDDVGEAEGYRIKPSYATPRADDAASRFFLQARHGYASANGVIGEQEFFDAFESAARNPTSPLYRARAIPNFFVIREEVGLPDGKTPWVQVDCVLVTTKGLVSVEVKRRGRPIEIPQGFLRQRGGAGDLGQAVFHRLAVARYVDVVPDDRVLCLLVYVRPKRFVCVSEHEWQGRMVAQLAPDAPADTGCIERLEEVLSGMDDVMDQAQVDALGAELLQRCGDLNRRKTYLHTLRVTRARPPRRPYSQTVRRWSPIHTA